MNSAATSAGDISGGHNFRFPANGGLLHVREAYHRGVNFLLGLRVLLAMRLTWLYRGILQHYREVSCIRLITSCGCPQ